MFASKRVRWSVCVLFVGLMCGAAGGASANGYHYNWSGLYGGTLLSYGDAELDGSVSVPDGSNIGADPAAIADGALTGSLEEAGWGGGITLGYNHQSGSLVVGIEGDYQYLDISGTRNSGVIAAGGETGVGQDRLAADWLATLRLRLAYTAGPTLMYVTGGLAFTDAAVTRSLDWSYSDACPAADAGRVRCHSGTAEFDMGWALGGGFEWALSDNWSLKSEYLYIDFGDATVVTARPGVEGQTLKHTLDLDMHLFRLGLNYRFNAH